MNSRAIFEDVLLTGQTARLSFDSQESLDLFRSALHNARARLEQKMRRLDFPSAVAKGEGIQSAPEDPDSKEWPKIYKFWIATKSTRPRGYTLLSIEPGPQEDDFLS